MWNFIAVFVILSLCINPACLLKSRPDKIKLHNQEDKQSEFVKGKSKFI